MKKLKKNNIMLYLSFLSIVFAAIIVSAVVRYNEITQKRSSKFLSENAKSLFVEDCEDVDFWVKRLKNEKYDNFVLYNVIEDPDYDVRGVFYKGEMEGFPMIKGEFLKENEYGNKPCMVVGKNHQDEIYIENGESFFDYQNVAYKVVGIVGEKIESRINDVLFIDFSSSIQISGVNSYYLLDSTKKANVKGIVESLYQSAQYPERVSYTEQMENGFFGKLLEKGKITGTMYGAMLVIFLISTVLTTNLWLENRKKKIGVFALNGYSKAQIVWEIIIEYFKLALVAYAGGVICATVLSLAIWDFDVNIQDYIGAFLVSVGFGVIALLYPIYLILRMQVANIIRG